MLRGITSSSESRREIIVSDVPFIVRLLWPVISKTELVEVCLEENTSVEYVFSILTTMMQLSVSKL